MTHLNPYDPPHHTPDNASGSSLTPSTLILSVYHDSRLIDSREISGDPYLLLGRPNASYFGESSTINAVVTFIVTFFAMALLSRWLMVSEYFDLLEGHTLTVAHVVYFSTMFGLPFWMAIRTRDQTYPRFCFFIFIPEDLTQEFAWVKALYLNLWGTYVAFDRASGKKLATISTNREGYLLCRHDTTSQQTWRLISSGSGFTIHEQSSVGILERPLCTGSFDASQLLLKLHYESSDNPNQKMLLTILSTLALKKLAKLRTFGRRPTF